jgi:hypothetical protein
MSWKATRGIAAIAAVSAVLAAHSARAEDSFDPTGRSLDLFDICFQGSARMSDKCYGFIGAIVEIVETEQLVSRDRRFSPPYAFLRGSKSRTSGRP